MVESSRKLLKVLVIVLCICVVVLIVLCLAYISKSKKEKDSGKGSTKSVVSEEGANSEEESSSETDEEIFTTKDMTRPEDKEQKDETSSQTDVSSQAETPAVTDDSSEAEGNEEESDYSRRAELLLENMSTHEKICQMFIVTPEQLTGYSLVTQAGDTTRSSIRENPVGGVIYFAQNLESYEQTKQMITDTQRYSKELTGIPMFISVDEEGGTVARCADNIGTTAFDDMYTYKDMGADVAYQNAKTIAEDLNALGFNLDFAPVADTWSNSENTVIGYRAYSNDFEQTAELVASAVKGFNDGGVFCTLKHFPGHGDTATDSHYGAAITYKSIYDIEEQEYLAFEKGIEAGADMVMVGHITVNWLDSIPASLSYTVITGELRNKLGYDGIIITDSMQMGAITNNYSSGEMAVKTVLAGTDIILMPADLDAAISALEAAVEDGTISEERINESVKRILELKLRKYDF